MKLIRQTIKKDFIDDKTIITEIMEYHYDTEEEKNKHKKVMEDDGWIDSGQVREMVAGSLMPDARPPVYVWYGNYRHVETITNNK